MFKYLSSALLILLATEFLSGCLPSTVLVDTPTGEIIGINNNSYHSFMGIPYAKAPVGSRRWASPEPYDTFNTPFKAYRARAGCMQFAGFTTVSQQSEDCLFLNIWKPANTSETLPVMVWIHGGSLALGSGTEDQYLGYQLAIEQNAIVVSMNYRLGYLGFLSLPELTAEAGRSGNFAFLDQSLAIEWVKENISAFGGDPDQLFLFGESAGASSTCLQLASPLTGPLINNAAMQSGSCGRTAKTQSEAEQDGVAFAELVGCTTDRANCLRNMPVAAINQVLTATGFENSFFGASSALPLSLVIDDYFMTQQPNEALAGGAANGKGIIIGINKDEGTLFSGSIPNMPTETDYQTALSEQFGINAAAVESLYPYAFYPTGVNALADIWGDQVFGCNALNTATALSNGGANVHFYYFNQAITAPLLTSSMALLFQNDIQMGTFHSSEIPYIFGRDSVMGSVSGDQLTTANYMQSYWKNTAANGEPNSTGLPAWPSFDETAKSYLKMNSAATASSELKVDKCALLATIAGTIAW